MSSRKDYIVRALTSKRRRSIPRIVLDLFFWAGAVLVGSAMDHPAAKALAVLWIGAVPMHDLLVHGHEGAHGLIARTRWVNELFTWLSHALVGISGTAYRLFHLDHHRWLETDRDPEYRLLNIIARGVPGWAYLGIPLTAHLAVNSYPFRIKSKGSARWAVARDFAGMILLHGASARALGAIPYLLFVALPIFTSLAAVVVLRSICEHHGTYGRSPWTNTRTMDAGAVLDFLWSNTSYHLEHHLFPFVPYDQLPALRRAVAPELARRGGVVDKGFLTTALGLLREPVHFRPKEN